MKSLGMFHGAMPEMIQDVYKTLWEYAINLAPMSVKVRHKLYQVGHEHMETIFGKWERLSHLFHLEPDIYRKVLLIQKYKTD